MKNLAETALLCRSFNLSPHLVIEDFDEKALILLADRDVFMTVNKATACLLDLIHETFAGRDFSAEELGALMGERFDMTSAEVSRNVLEFLAFTLRHDLVVETENL